MQPHTSYLVCATPRSGSTLLCEALTNTQRAGYPAEYFEALRTTGLPRRPKEYFADGEISEITDIPGNYSRIDQRPQQIANYANYLAEVFKKGTTPNGVFGAKMMWGYLDDFISHVRQISHYREMAVPDILSAVFPNLQYILVTRNDKVRQAVSLWKAIQTQTWRIDGQAQKRTRSKEQSAHSEQELVFNFAAIDHLVQRITEQDAAWRAYCACTGIQPFTVVYEELVHTYQETAIAILKYLRIPVPMRLTFAPRTMQRQANALSEEWVQRYWAIKQGRKL